MKFDENSRRRVIRELQREYGVELTRIGHPWKYLKDEKGGRYVVLGGNDYRYDIPRAIFDEEARNSGSCMLVVAIQDRIPLDNDHYVVHVHRFTSRLVVREIPSLELSQLNRQAPEDSARGA